MRGLDIRCAYTSAHLIIAIHSASTEPSKAQLEAMDEAAEAVNDAYCQGYHDWADLETDCPILFKDVPALQKAWNDGQNMACETEEMSHCSGCQDSHGDPCPFHG